MAHTNWRSFDNRTQSRNQMEGPTSLDERTDARTYGVMPFLDRARLLQTDPKRHMQLRSAYERRVHELLGELEAATTLAERKRVRSVIAELSSTFDDPTEGPSAA